MRHLWLAALPLLLVVGAGAAWLLARPPEGRSQGPTPSFPYGMFEDIWLQDPDSFGATLDDLRARGLDTILFTNGRVAHEDALLAVADGQQDVGVLLGPHEELLANWYHNAEAPTDLATAREIIGPLVDGLKDHPSLRGYNVMDDSPSDLAQKIALAVQVFQERDPARPALPVIVGAHEAVYRQARPRVLLTYAYPVGATQGPCDFHYPGFKGAGASSFVDYVRQLSRYRDADVPLWLILQTHGELKGFDPAAAPITLREPSVEEVRLQNWLAVGEGATGIFWFVYSTHPHEWWTGLRDKPTLYAEVTDLAQRMAKVRATLAALHKTRDLATVAGGPAYASTLVSADGQHTYVVVANQQCSPQDLAVRLPGFQGQLADLESGARYAAGAPIPFRGGDGKLLEAVGFTASAPPADAAPPANVVANPSFETRGGASPERWQERPAAHWDGATAHSGSAALRLEGPGDGYTFQAVPLKPATYYSLSYWVKLQGTGGRGVSVRYVEEAPDEMLLLRGPWTADGADWQQVTDTFYVPESFGRGRLDLMWDLADGEVAWIDDVALCEGKGGCEAASAR